MTLKRIRTKKKLGKGLSSLLVDDEELSLIVKKPGRPKKKIQPGEFKKNLKTSPLILMIYSRNVIELPELDQSEGYPEVDSSQITVWP